LRAKPRSAVAASDDSPRKLAGKSVSEPLARVAENYLWGDAGFVSFTRLAVLSSLGQISQHACQHRQEHRANMRQFAILGLAEQYKRRLGSLETAQPDRVGEIQAAKVHVEAPDVAVFEKFAHRLDFHLLIDGAQRAESLVEQSFQLGLGRVLAELPEGRVRAGDHHLLAIDSRRIEGLFVDRPVVGIFEMNAKLVENGGHSLRRFQKGLGCASS
jgi:hypothetical protein